MTTQTKKQIAPPRASMIEELQWHKVESSNIDLIAWHPTDRIVAAKKGEYGLLIGWLFVRFHEGKVYAYRDVPGPVYEAIRNADSVGSAFNKLVRSAGVYSDLGEVPERR